MIGYGGLEDVRFRGVVRPGDRSSCCTAAEDPRLMLTCEFQCFVGQNLVCEGMLKGVPLRSTNFWRNGSSFSCSCPFTTTTD